MNSLEKDIREPDLVLCEPAMKELYAQARQIAPTSASVLITGDSGTGKDFLARYIHRNSPRAGKPFVHISCGAVPPDLFESEFFGYEGGAFTGARPEGHKGLVSQADGGTLFLDEIGELTLELQAKLLLLVQEHRSRSLGAGKEEVFDIRFISATNRPLIQMIHDGTFRLDLYYRLNVVSFYVPPLSRRPKDLLALLQSLSARMQAKYHCRKTFSQDALDYLLTLPWHGNLREVQNFMERLYVLEEEEQITEQLLRENYHFLRL